MIVSSPHQHPDREKRKQQRIPYTAIALLRSSAQELCATVFNISATGFLLYDPSHPLLTGEEYTLFLTIFGGRTIRCKGMVVWTHGDHAGFRISDDLGYGDDLRTFINDLAAAYRLLDQVNQGSFDLSDDPVDYSPGATA